MPVSLFTDYLSASAATSLLIASLLLLAPWLRQRYSAKWMYWIWMTLAVRLLLPFHFSFGDSLIDIRLPESPDNRVVVQDVWQVQSQAAPSGAAPPVQTAVDSVSHSPSLPGLLAMIWIAGAVFFIIYHAAGYGFFRKQALRWSRPIESRQFASLIQSIKAAMRVPESIPVLTSGKVPNPMLVGFRKPLLLLPHEHYSEQQLEFIVKHELIHYKHRDMLYKLLLLTVRALHWFNPLVWLMAREASRQMELHCDEAVVSKQSLAYRKKYCETILSSIEQPKSRFPALSTHLLGDEHTMKLRFKSILSMGTKRSGIMLFCSVILALGLLIAFGANITNGSSALKPGTIYSSLSEGKVITYDAGNSYSVDAEGNVTVSYRNGEVIVDVPLKLDPTYSDLGLHEHATGFFISEDKTAIVYGTATEEGTFLHVLISDDMGKTWNSYPMEGAEGYIGKYIGFTTKKDGWIVTNNPANLGSARSYIYQTSDGGKTWEEIGNPNEIYTQVLTGAGFSNKDIGFLGYRYYETYGPVVYWTKDRGRTWEKLPIALPEKYESIRKNPLSPSFNGNEGLLPIQLNGSEEGITGTIYLTTKDYGVTWTYDESYDQLD